jgi:hypothetical protein
MLSFISLFQFLCWNLTFSFFLKGKSLYSATFEKIIEKFEKNTHTHDRWSFANYRRLITSYEWKIDLQKSPAGKWFLSVLYQLNWKRDQRLRSSIISPGMILIWKTYPGNWDLNLNRVFQWIQDKREFILEIKSVMQMSHFV